MNYLSKLTVISVFTLSYSVFAADTNINDRLIEFKGTLSSINEELSSQRANIGELRAQSNYQEKVNREILNELKSLRRQNQAVIDSLYSKEPNGDNKVVDIKPIKDYDLKTPDGKMIFGEDEFFYIKEADAIIDARIDTGAATSSLSAQDITEFERKGKKWIKFKVVANDRTIEVEAPFVRYSDIRQAASKETIRRYVVSLNIKVADYATQSEFTLHDRSRMQYALLIGRSLMQDIAVVDVSRDHVQGKPVSNNDAIPLLILSRDDYEDAKKKGKNPNELYDKKKESKAGQIAYPQQEFGNSIGTDSKNALPLVQAKKEQKASE